MRLTKFTIWIALLTTGAAHASPATLIADGRDLYIEACSPCHGKKGDGAGPAARFLEPKPRDFTKGKFKFRSTEFGSPPTDADLIRTIRVGVPGTSMPAWGGEMDDEEVLGLVAYLKTFSDAFDEPLEDDELIAVPDEVPAATARVVAEGRALYLTMKCWRCHGVDGTGDGPSSDTLRDAWDEPIDAYDFTSGVFKSGTLPQDIFRTFSTGLAGTPMPAFAESVNVPAEAARPDAFDADELGADERAELIEGSAGWPSAAELGDLDEAAAHRLSVERRWSLVHYILSISGGEVVRYLIGDPYVNQP